MRPVSYPRLVALIAVGALVVSACSSNATSPSPEAGGGGGGGGTSVAVTLQEWAVVPASTSVAAGDVTFEVSNAGPEDVHEFVILRTDLDAGSLPTDETGAASEEGEGMEVVNEIEDIEVGDSQSLTVTLSAGNYVLLCNIYDDEEDEAHYQLGMRTAFTVGE